MCMNLLTSLGENIQVLQKFVDSTTVSHAVIHCVNVKMFPLTSKRVALPEFILWPLCISPKLSSWWRSKKGVKRTQARIMTFTVTLCHLGVSQNQTDSTDNLARPLSVSEGMHTANAFAFG